MDNIEKIRKASREYARRNRARVDAALAVWRQDNPKRYAYLIQKNGAKKRSIPWEFTFDAWVNWWGKDFEHRGSQGTDLCMCRYHDIGAYATDNVYKATRKENSGGARRG